MPLEYVSKLTGKAGILDQRIHSVMEAAGHLLRDQIQEYAPVDIGNLTRGIKAQPPVLAGGQWVETIISQMGYWRYLEEPQYTGGKHLGPKSVAKGSKMPFIKPAYKAKKAEIRTLIHDGFKKAVKDISIR